MHDYLSIFKHTLRLRNKTFNDPISIFGDKKIPHLKNAPQEPLTALANVRVYVSQSGCCSAFSVSYQRQPPTILISSLFPMHFFIINSY
jgi:hypothetical protein